MSRTRRIVTIALCAAVTGTVIIPTFIHADDKPGVTAVAATKPAARDLDAIDKELKAAGEQFRQTVPNMKLIADAKFRKENADKALPPLKKIADLLNEIATTQNEPSAAEARYRMLAMGVAFGDQDSSKALTAAAESKNKDESISAKSALALGNWINNSEDPKAQAKILEDYTALAKAEPKDDKIAGTLMIMSQLGAANDNMSKQAINVIRAHLTGEAAQQINQQTASLDKPITLVGRTTAGARFNSSTYKGKVILVDFWATWCGPCREALPGVKKLYETYHDKGLEIIGVDCDSSDEKVNAFTKENKMPWVQLREQSQTDQEQWHPLAKKYGVDAIPTMFIIDKKGILRYLDGEGDTEARVKALLAEPGPEAEKPATPAK
jgi:thiol-disulfide isomerase/thioredoxin